MRAPPFILYDNDYISRRWMEGRGGGMCMSIGCGVVDRERGERGGEIMMMGEVVGRKTSSG